MRGELLFVKQPERNYIKWVIFYSLLIIFTLFGLYQVAAHVRTHGLPAGSMVLSVPYTKYVVGEEITFVLKNNFNSVVFISNNCPQEPLAVYKQVSGSWVRQHDQTSEENCVDEARSIGVAPNGDVKGSFAKWKNLFSTPGKYRVVAYVEYYNSLPYADFEIVDKTAVAQNAPAAAISKVTNAKADQATSAPSAKTPTWSPAPSVPATQPPATGGGGGSTVQPKTVTVNVNSSGNYSNTNIALNVGDSILFVYTAPIDDEIVTRFTRISGSGSISSLKLDHDRTSGSRTFSTAGVWTFKASDSNGNTGTVTVN